MKTIKITITAFALMIINVGFATVLTVNNATGSVADYSLLQDAVAAASAGDTILVSASTTKYDGASGIDINKRLVIIGAGFSELNRATVYDITFTSTNASGTVLKGLYIYTDVSDFNNPVNKVLIERCYIERNFTFYGSNSIFNGCVFQTSVSLGSSSSGVTISNCAISQGIRSSKNYTNLATNCVFFTFNSNNFYYTTALTITNSIFYNSYCNESDIIFKNNLSVGSGADFTFPIGGGNENNILNQDPTFVKMAGTTFSLTDDYHLKAGSPAIGKGIGGVDLGIYGGDNPFSADFAPAIPRIIHLQSSASVVPKDGVLKVNVKAVSVK